MLVLSRRLNEKILLPTINASLQVVAIKPGVVRIGIDAPPDVLIMREELQNRGREAPAAEPTKSRAHAGVSPLRALLPQVRDQLKAAAMGLGLLQLQLDTCATDEAKATLADLREALQVLHCGIDGELEQAPSQPADLDGRVDEAVSIEDAGVVEELEGQLCGV
jgi:carbon storage regulator CsrA